jgi:UDP-N-acetylmuramate: L-alanyl-gamma-D-glutamyl-meso-diaminopimelate ligase
MHLHILGIAGTFMGGLARLASEAGHRVTGCDAHVYPPMSTQLQAAGISLIQGYDAAQTALKPDVYIIGNAISRSNPLLEAILDQGLPYLSGPQWLFEHVLKDRWVLAVAGTHGKTTTSSLLAWILEQAGLSPGFLIGGVPGNFGISARLGQTPFFVIEADEYDTAFCDKRSKFVHYRPRTLVLNNLEFDHADIFTDLAAIETQFHHLVRTLPSLARIVVNAQEPALARVLERGCWSEQEAFNSPEKGWAWTRPTAGEPHHLAVHWCGELLGQTRFPMAGHHNASNALAAVAAARHVGVLPAQAIAALASFEGVRRRLEWRGTVGNVAVYDDFAHHPTAIAVSIGALREHMAANARLIAVLEPRSNTMKQGALKARLPESLSLADAVFCSSKGVSWDIAEALAVLGEKAQVLPSSSALLERLLAFLKPGDHVLIMSNGSFDGLHQALLERLSSFSSE